MQSAILYSSSSAVLVFFFLIRVLKIIVFVEIFFVVSHFPVFVVALR